MEMNEAIRILEERFRKLSTSRLIKVDGDAYKERNAISLAIQILSRISKERIEKVIKDTGKFINYGVGMDEHWLVNPKDLASAIVRELKGE